MRSGRFPVALLLLLAGIVAACGTARREDSRIGQPGGPQDPQLVAGQHLFMRECHQCHPRGEAGWARR